MHSLAYEALNSDAVDVIAVYTSDGQIAQSDLVILEDDLDFFPEYLAAFLSRQNTDQEALRHAMIRRGDHYLTGTDVEGQRHLRLCVMNPGTTVEVKVRRAKTHKEEVVKLTPLSCSSSPSTVVMVVVVVLADAKMASVSGMAASNPTSEPKTTSAASAQRSALPCN